MYESDDLRESQEEILLRTIFYFDDSAPLPEEPVIDPKGQLQNGQLLSPEARRKTVLNPWVRSLIQKTKCGQSFSDQDYAFLELEAETPNTGSIEYFLNQANEIDAQTLPEQIDEIFTALRYLLTTTDTFGYLILEASRNFKCLLDATRFYPSCDPLLSILEHWITDKHAPLEPILAVFTEIEIPHLLLMLQDKTCEPARDRLIQILMHLVKTKPHQSILLLNDLYAQIPLECMPLWFREDYLQLIMNLIRSKAITVDEKAALKAWLIDVVTVNHTLLPKLGLAFQVNLLFFMITQQLFISTFAPTILLQLHAENPRLWVAQARHYLPPLLILLNDKPSRDYLTLDLIQLFWRLVNRDEPLRKEAMELGCHYTLLEIIRRAPVVEAAHAATVCLRFMLEHDANPDQTRQHIRSFGGHIILMHCAKRHRETAREVGKTLVFLQNSKTVPLSRHPESSPDHI